jgi:acyl-CoA dehydrogenase family protein 9
VEATTVKDQSSAREGVSSFAKSLFFGEIHDDLVFPYPMRDDEEQDKVRSLIASLREFAAESIDMPRIEEQGWIGDDVVRGLGERVTSL